MANDYKTAKEAFVSNQSGSSVFHVLAISAVAPSSVILYSIVKNRVRPRRHNVFTDYTILVLPMLLSMTGSGADHPLILNACLLIIAKCLTIIPSRPTDFLPSSRPSSPKLSPASPMHNNIGQQFEFKPQPQITESIAALTVYRSHMLIMTFLAILAVDFTIFPRNLVKCETFGVSLMDIGVGSFVFSQGIVSAKKIVKDPSYLVAPVTPKLYKALKGVFPMVLLGLIRVILVKGSDYPEHVSEYGVHWNFFLSMAALPVVEIILHSLLSKIHVLYIGFGVMLIHQCMLSYLQDWTLNAPRTDIISQNKEGIVSLLGYLAIHILGLLTGTIILPPSPSDFKRRKESPQNTGSNMPSFKEQLRQPSKIAIELCSYAILWWFLFFACNLINLGQGVSRRLANALYVIWVAAYNTTFLTAYVTLDIVFYSTPSTATKKSNNQHLTPGSTDQTPYFGTALKHQEPLPLLHAINKNGLVLFLVANATTGLINLTIQTLYTSDLTAFLILMAYSLGLSIIAWVLRSRKLF